MIIAQTCKTRNYCRVHTDYIKRQDDYISTDAAAEISAILGIKISLRKYYKLLHELGIRNEVSPHVFCAPYDDGKLFWHEEQSIYSNHSGNLKVHTNTAGIKEFVRLYKEKHNLP